MLLCYNPFLLLRPRQLIKKPLLKDLKNLDIAGQRFRKCSVFHHLNAQHATKDNILLMWMGTKSFIGLARFPGMKAPHLCSHEYSTQNYRGTRDSYYKGAFFVANEEVDRHLEAVNYRDESVSIHTQCIL